jgi:hypothetical protein
MTSTIRRGISGWPELSFLKIGRLILLPRGGAGRSFGPWSGGVTNRWPEPRTIIAHRNWRTNEDVT